MEHPSLCKFTLETSMQDFLPMPRGILTMELPRSAMLLYCTLLGRATLSRKNGFADEGGWVYVIYTMEHLAEDLGISLSVVKKRLKDLENAGLILRKRPVGNRASYIFLNIPQQNVLHPSMDQKGTSAGSKRSRSGCQKETASKLTKQIDINKLIYLTYEEDSL